MWTDPFAPLAGRLRPSAAFMPAADVTVSDNDVVLTLDLPGLAPENLSIEAQDNYVTVRGERPLPRLAQGIAFIHAERPLGAFERRFQVPKDTDPGAIAAKMEHGVLKLTIPKPERTKPKTIQIDTKEEQQEQLEPAMA